jgi:hypothetical protein
MTRATHTLPPKYTGRDSSSKLCSFDLIQVPCQRYRQALVNVENPGPYIGHRLMPEQSAYIRQSGMDPKSRFMEEINSSALHLLTFHVNNHDFNMT